MILFEALKMLKKIYQADFLLLPEHEFWNMYIPLKKRQGFSTTNVLVGVQKNLQTVEDLIPMNMPCFTLDGQVLSVNKKCAPHPLLISKRPSKKTKKHLERKLKWPLKLFLKRKSQITNELGELLKRKIIERLGPRLEN